MSDDPNFGITTTESVDAFLEWKVKGSGERSPSEKPERSETQSVEMLPVWDATGATWQPWPKLRITVTFREGISNAQAWADLLLLYQTVNQTELTNGGKGLKLGTTTGEGRNVEITFIPESPIDAETRLARLVCLVNDPGGIQIPHFENWEARIERSAA